jgi:hypothetical protein
LQASDLAAGVMRRSHHRGHGQMPWQHRFCDLTMKLKISSHSVVGNRETLMAYCQKHRGES